MYVRTRGHEHSKRTDQGPVATDDEPGDGRLDQALETPRVRPKTHNGEPWPLAGVPGLGQQEADSQTRVYVGGREWGLGEQGSG